MKTIPYGTSETLPAFNMSPSDPLYWVSLQAYEELTTYKALRAQGVDIVVAEQADYVAAQTAFDGLSDTLQSWLTGAVAASESGEEIPALSDDYIPELLQFLALALTGQWGAVFVLFVKVGLDFVIKWLRGRLQPGNTRLDAAETLDTALLVRDSGGRVIGSRLESLGTVTVTINGDDAIGCLWVEALGPETA